MKVVTISDIAALRAACDILPSLYGLDADAANYSLRMRWEPIDIIAMQHGLDLIDRALARNLRDAKVKP